jgi:hypothetical protein
MAMAGLNHSPQTDIKVRDRMSVCMPLMFFSVNVTVSISHGLLGNFIFKLMVFYSMNIIVLLGAATAGYCFIMVPCQFIGVIN